MKHKIGVIVGDFALTAVWAYFVVRYVGRIQAVTKAYRDAIRSIHGAR